MAAASVSRRLSASAPPYSKKSSVSHPVSELYMGPPAAALPPAGFFYPPPVLIAPPSPCFPATSLSFWGFPSRPSVVIPGSYSPPSWAPLSPPRGPCVGMQGSPSLHPGWTPFTPQQGPCVGMPGSSQLTPMAPAGMPPCAPPPQQPGMKAKAPAGRHRASRGGPARRARPPPRLEVPPRMQRAAGRVVAPPSASRVGEVVAGVGKEEQANEPSPRSVLVQSSPPLTPSALPTSFPYPELGGTPSPPASEAVTVRPAAEGKAVVPPRRRRGGERVPRRCRQAAVRTPKPRRVFDPTSDCTSLMIRNIPNDFRRTRLMQIIDQHCSIENGKITTGDVKSEYDFLYLPMDFSTGANKGFAFVNLTTPEAARRLRHHLHNHRWKVNGSGKTCEIDEADRKGLHEMVKKLSDSRFDCCDEEFLPVWFEPPRDGTRTPVPHLVGRMLRC